MYPLGVAYVTSVGPKVLATVSYNNGRLIVYAKGRVDGAAWPVVTKLGKFYPEPPCGYLTVVATGAMPDAAVRRNTEKKVLATDGGPIDGTRLSFGITTASYLHDLDAETSTGETLASTGEV